MASAGKALLAPAVHKFPSVSTGRAKPEWILDSLLLRPLEDFGLLRRWTASAEGFFATTPLYGKFLSFDPGPPDPGA